MPHLSDPDNIATSPDGKEPSSPSVDNDEEVELLGVVVSPADALTPAFKSGTQDLLSTPAVKTEVTNVFAFFNPQASKKPRCSTLRDCFNITHNELGGITVTCKNALVKMLLHQKLTARWYWWVMKLWNCYDPQVLWSKGFFKMKYWLKQSHKSTLNDNI